MRLSLLPQQPTLSKSTDLPTLARPESDTAHLAHLMQERLQAFLAADTEEGSQQPWPQWPDFPDGGGGAGGGGGEPMPGVPAPGDGARRGGGDHTLAILLPLLILLTTLLFLIVLLTLLLLRRRSRSSIALPGSEGDVGGPINLAEPEALFRGAEGGFEGVEGRWLEEQDEQTRRAYERGKAWQLSSPPNSHPSEITLSQFLSIQEKGVSAWSFEPDYESAPPVVVAQRTEITFLDATAADEPCCVMSNLPVPRLNECYYWEVKCFELPGGTGVSVGLGTRPYPSFRLPGHSPHSIAYHSPDGFLSASYPFLSRSYGPSLSEGDTLGVGYRPRTGTVFFTRNGRSLGDAFVGFNKFNVFPLIGATGPCALHVNLGQAGFVFIEANVKKWGLAPMLGTLAPPPAYGSEGGSVLLEAGGAAARDRDRDNDASLSHSHHLSTASASSSRPRGHRRQASSTASATAAAAAAAALGSSLPIRPSPLRHAHAHPNSHSRQPSTASSASHTHTRTPSPATAAGAVDGASGEGEEQGEEEDQGPANPPTPGLLDISLHSMHRFPDRVLDGGDAEDDDEEEEAEEGEHESEEGEGEGAEERPLRQGGGGAAEAAAGQRRNSPPPPEYNAIDPHMYAPGVAETILEDALSSFSHAPAASSSSSGVTSSSSPSAAAAALLNPAQAALLQRFVAERAARAGAGSPSAAAYEGRTEGRQGGGGGVWGWLTGGSGGGR